MITVIRETKTFDGSKYVRTSADRMPTGFDPTGYTYRSIGGAKRAIAAQIRSGMYGSEQWDFLIDETTYTGNGASFVEVCTYERQSQQVAA
jgi:hypothetical protein